MKKIIVLVLIVMMFSTVVYASGTTTTIYVNGETLQYDGQPQVMDNQVYLPLSMVEQTFDKNIFWNGTDTLTVTDERDLSEVDIPATIDGTVQKAMFYSASVPNQPLIIFLHTWGANYATVYQDDGIVLSDEILKKDWNYIQPNFRGANNNPDACVSTKVLSDIDDAVNYAIANGNSVDMNNIYVIGPSGGGLAALAYFMKSTQNYVKGYYLWVPISDLAAWFYQTLDKGYTDYFYEISYSLNCQAGKLNFTEAQNRSPLYATTPLAKFNTSFIKFYAGIHDGYNGHAVPFTHSIIMFNKLLKDRNMPDARVPIDDYLYMTAYQEPPTPPVGLGTLADGSAILYQNIPDDKLSLTIFDGGHDIDLLQVMADLENAIGQ
jgi:hypothetical protein